MRFLRRKFKEGLKNPPPTCNHCYDFFAVAVMRQSHPDWVTTAWCEVCGDRIEFNPDGTQTITPDRKPGWSKRRAA